MFYDDNTERAILHASTSKTPYSGNGKKLIKPQMTSHVMEPRKIGGSSGVAVYKPAGKKIKGGAKTQRKPNAWQEMIKKIMTEKNLSFKDSIKYIKQHNLYK
jgi:hypothetical protein